MRDRSIRRLTYLQQSGASSRVLNLQKIAERSRKDPDHRRRPFFQTRALNESIILKHRLRGNEVDLFEEPCSVATKVILPLDPRDLRAGGQFFFIGQRDFDAALRQAIGETGYANEADRRLLRLLNATPSFDPFLLREALRREHYSPAECYLVIPPGEALRMQSFVQAEMSDLASLDLSAGGASGASSFHLARKLTSETALDELEPLRLALKFNRNDFADGVFAWRGMLYYKWVLSNLAREMPGVVDEIQNLRSRMPPSADIARQMVRARRKIATEINRAQLCAGDIVALYDRAYGALVAERNPAKFRAFLFEAPSLFTQLGEILGALTHVVSFWRYRVKRGAAINITSDDLCDIFADFELSLSPREEDRSIQSELPQKSLSYA